MPGHILYTGPSLIDGAPIVVIAITSSTNRKTGDMVQTYILRADMDPRDANRTGADRSICGDCPHRGTPRPDAAHGLAAARSCYVFLAQGPLQVYRSFLRGAYSRADTPAQRRAIGRGRMVRIGTYGDGAAAPAHVWDDLIADASGHTAYTHQATSPQALAAYAPRYMISADTLPEAQAAWAAGARTFRTVASVADVVRGAEVLCPASPEAGARATCQTCGLCAGTSKAARSVAIVVHGAGRKYAPAVAA
jgi:hypothetical protein